VFEGVFILILLLLLVSIIMMDYDLVTYYSFTGVAMLIVKLFNFEIHVYYSNFINYYCCY
jgi:hypothetical protein